jgi:hypothetical protein
MLCATQSFVTDWKLLFTRKARDMPKLVVTLRARDQHLGIAVSVENVA